VKSGGENLQKNCRIKKRNAVNSKKRTFNKELWVFLLWGGWRGGVAQRGVGLEVCVKKRGGFCMGKGRENLVLQGKKKGRGVHWVWKKKRENGEGKDRGGKKKVFLNFAGTPQRTGRKK